MTMRLAQVAMHSPETLGLAGIVAGLLLFLTGYVVGAQGGAPAPLAAASGGGAEHCPAFAQGAAPARGEFEPLASDGRERKVKTIIFSTPTK
jgi:hypothetical protein